MKCFEAKKPYTVGLLIFSFQKEEQNKRNLPVTLAAVSQHVEADEELFEASLDFCGEFELLGG